MQAMRGGNSSALNSIHQRLGKVEGAVGVTFASNISQLSDKVHMGGGGGGAGKQ